MSPTDKAALLAAYDAQLRDHLAGVLPPSVRAERDGPVVRYDLPKGRGYVLYRDLGGLRDAELDALIARQVRHFADRGARFEWKLHGHDQPADLPDRLRAAGFEPEERETIVIGLVADIASPPRPPDGVALREVTERRDFERIGALEMAVWNDDDTILPEMLAEEHELDPEAISIVVAEAGDEVVCAGWIRFAAGTVFATLWGGATLPEWRGRGIYRATVAHRASLAAARGFTLLETDASDDSRPILERLGFVPVTTTTPYVWSPPA